MKSRVENGRAVVVAVCIMSWMVCASLSQAAITPLGDITPTYDGSQPWNVGGLLTIGVTGEATLTVSDGSGLVAGETFVGSEAGSVGHLVLTGAGSTWQGVPSPPIFASEVPIAGGATMSRTDNVATIGRHGTGDVTIADGAKVVADGGLVNLGFWRDGVGTLTITGPNSSWQDTGGVWVGYMGTGTLVISKGGTATSTGPVFIGHSGRGNVTVEDPGSAWQIKGPLEVGRSGQGSLLVSAGGRVESTYGYVDSSDSGSMTATVTGSGSLWQIEQYLVVGGDYNGGLKIENGAQMADTDAYLAWRKGSISLVQVRGPGSVWSSSGELSVGAAGSATLHIKEGGRVAAAGSVTARDPGSEAVITVENVGSTWMIDHTLSVGEGGHTDLTIADGGQVLALRSRMGHLPGSAGDGVVKDPNSLWQITQDLIVGESASANVLVSNGGRLASGSAVIGQLNGSTGTVTVTGPGSTWGITDDFYVGEHGSANLVVSDGGQVTAYRSFVALESPSVASITVTGPRSRWLTDGSLVLGGFGHATMIVSDGGRVTSGYSTLAESPGSFAAVTVSGAGSVWDGPAELDVGSQGNGLLVVSAGGRVESGTSYMGKNATGRGVVLVTGPGSIWQSSGDLYLGSRGVGDLTIADGGRVVTPSAYLGVSTGSSGSAVVTGAGSVWQVPTSLCVGGTTAGPGGTAALGVYDGGVVEGRDVAIWRTGTLQGNGILRAERVLSFGTIKPGASIGTLTVDGNLDLATDGVLEAEVDNSGRSDKLLVTGAFRLMGGTIKPIATETITGSHEYTIVEANSVANIAVAGGGTAVLPTALLASGVLVGPPSDPNSVLLTVVETPFNDPGLVRTENQRSLGAALQQVAEGGGNALTMALQQLPTADQVRSAYDQLSGQTTPSLAPITIDETTTYVSIVSDRLRTARMDRRDTTAPRASAPRNGWEDATGIGVLDRGTSRYAFALGNGTPYLADEPWGVWGQGYGLFSKREGKSGIPGYQDSIYGAGLGVDYRFTPRWLLGLTGGYAEGDIQYSASRNSSDISSKHIGLYGGYDRSAWYLHSIVAYADLDYETKRYVDVTGAQLEGEPSGNVITGYLEGGLNWSIQTLGLVRPLASVQVSSLHIGSFTETGAAESLHFGANSYQSCRGSLGVEWIRQLFEHPDGCRAALDLRGRWVHEFGDRRAAVDASFVGDPDVVFRVSDASLSRDSAILGTGLDTWFSRATGLFLDYGVELSKDITIHAVSAGLEHRW